MVSTRELGPTKQSALLGPPVVPFFPLFLGEGFPETDYRLKTWGTLFSNQLVWPPV